MQATTYIGKRLTVLGILLFFAVIATAAQGQTIGKDHQVTPQELARTLQSRGTKPLIFNVGPRVLYAQAHITGAEYIGSGSEGQGLAALKQRVKGLSKTAGIVLYCGCCPWAVCPNIGPAYEELRSLGFTQVKALYIQTNFGADWVDKGYPTVRGE